MLPRDENDATNGMSRVHANRCDTDAAQSGGTLGGWLLDRRGARSAWGSSPAPSLGSWSVACASSVTVRAMHERVAVISVDASTKRVRPRSASMAEKSVTIVGMIEREIAPKLPIFAVIGAGVEAPRQCAPPSVDHVSR
jgi:hypothetical protein